MIRNGLIDKEVNNIPLLTICSSGCAAVETTIRKKGNKKDDQVDITIGKDHMYICPPPLHPPRPSQECNKKLVLNVIDCFHVTHYISIY